MPSTISIFACSCLRTYYPTKSKSKTEQRLLVYHRTFSITVFSTSVGAVDVVEYKFSLSRALSLDFGYRAYHHGRWEQTLAIIFAAVRVSSSTTTPFPSIISYREDKNAYRSCISLARSFAPLTAGTRQFFCRM